jgi:hypothetical protein
VDEQYSETVVAEAEAEGTMAEEVEVARVMGQGVAAAVAITEAEDIFLVAAASQKAKTDGL